MIEEFYFTPRWNPNRYFQSESENLRVMAMKSHSTFSKAPGPLGSGGAMIYYT